MEVICNVPILTMGRELLGLKCPMLSSGEKTESMMESNGQFEGEAPLERVFKWALVFVNSKSFYVGLM